MLPTRGQGVLVHLWSLWAYKQNNMLQSSRPCHNPKMVAADESEDMGHSYFTSEYTLAALPNESSQR